MLPRSVPGITHQHLCQKTCTCAIIIFILFPYKNVSGLNITTKKISDLSLGLVKL